MRKYEREMAIQASNSGEMSRIPSTTGERTANGLAVSTIVDMKMEIPAEQTISTGTSRQMAM